MKRRILFLSPYPFNKAPSQRLKYEQYYPFIESAGYQIETSSFMSLSLWDIVYKKGNALKKLILTLQGYARRVRDIVRLKEFDVVYIHLWAVPFGPPIFEWIIGKRSKHLVYDIDDLIFMTPKSAHNPISSFLKSRNNSILLMKLANHIITCTPKLDEFVRQYNKKTTDISSTVNTAEYQPINSYKNDHQLVIGWSGSHSTVKYLHLLDEVFQALAEEINFVLKVFGTDNFELEGVEVIARPWSAAKEVEELQEIDIGVYPLPDEPWVYGKSGLKAIQYMSLGIPTVASKLGTIFRVIDDSEDGILVQTAEEWIMALKQLCLDPEMRRSIGQKARKKVEGKFSLDANAETYLDIIRASNGT